MKSGDESDEVGKRLATGRGPYSIKSADYQLNYLVEIGLLRFGSLAL